MREKPFHPCNRLFERCRLSFKPDRAAVPSLAVGGPVRRVEAESIRVKRRFGARDGLEGGDVSARRIA
jgi:hypothetical protein